MAAKISSHSQTLTFISHPDHMQITLRTHTLPHTHTLGHLSLCGSVQHQSGCWYPSGEGESCEWQEHVNSLKNKTKTNNSQKVPLDSQQNTVNGKTRLAESHTARWQQTVDQVRVWTVATLLSSSSSTVQSSSGGGGRGCEAKELTTEAFWPEMCKAKAHTVLTQDQEQQLWGFQAQEHERVGFSLHTELTFINIYICICIYINHSFSF